MPEFAPSAQQYKWNGNGVTRSPDAHGSNDKYFHIADIYCCAMAMPNDRKLDLIQTLIKCIQEEIA